MKTYGFSAYNVPQTKTPSIEVGLFTGYAPSMSALAAWAPVTPMWDTPGDMNDGFLNGTSCSCNSHRYWNYNLDEPRSINWMGKVSHPNELVFCSTFASSDLFTFSCRESEIRRVELIHTGVYIYIYTVIYLFIVYFLFINGCCLEGNI